jgi:HK97 family phage major capsid protein
MGALQGFSIGYRTKNATRDPKGVRTITSAHLAEVSFVTIPMNSRAVITAVKSEKKAMDIAELEKLTTEQSAKITDLEGKAAKVGELETKAGKLETELKAARDDLVKATKRTDELELKINRPKGGTADDEAKALEKKTWNLLLRRGRDALSEVETKTLRIADDVAGGYLNAPDEFVKEILKNVVEMSPMRQIARVTQISTSGARLPRRTGGPTANWTEETEDSTETESAYGQISIPAHEATAYIDVSQQLLEDAAFDVGAEVAADLAEEFGRLEGAAYVKGNGVKKPFGFVVDSSIGNIASVGASGFAASNPADVFFDIFHSIPTFYARNAVWTMNRRTMAMVRKFKDAQGRYLWEPSIASDKPPTLLGKPVIEMPDMDDVGAGKFPIAFGDFGQGYRIVDRIQIAIFRNPFLLANKGIVRFHARRRTGGAVVKSEALKLLKIAAS